MSLDYVLREHAHIIARCTEAQIKCAATQAENSQSPKSQPYSYKDFMKVLEEAAIDWNDVIGAFTEAMNTP